MGQIFAFGPFVLDMRNGTLQREGRPVALGQRSLALLGALVNAPGQVVSKAALMDAAWRGADVEESNLSVQIAALRKLLGMQADAGAGIVTVPRAGYRFVGAVRLLDPDESGGIAVSGHLAALADRPSIVVLPFAEGSDGSDPSWLADGLTEDTITALTRFRWFRVIGRNTSFAYKGRPEDARQVARDLGVAYVVEGSVRRSGQHVRISVQLVDAVSASQIWAERYEIELDEAFAVQDAIAERVAGAIEPELLKTQSLPAAAGRRADATAWELVRQGTWNFHHVGRQTHLRAREMFRQACRLDPELAEAHGWLGRVSAGILAYGWSEDPSGDIAEGLDAARAAVRLDGRNPYAHYALAICSSYANAPEQALLAAQKTIEISPSFALGHLVLGMAYLFGGSAADAIRPLEHGLALNPHDPQNFVWFNLLALSRLFDGKASEALVAAIEARKVRPCWRPIQETLVCCHVTLENWPQARSGHAEMMQMETPPGDALQPLRSRNPHWASTISCLLEKASS